MKLYLIDDDKNILNLLKRIIRDRGLGEICGTSQNALDALEDLASVRPDIIIVDLLMPEMDGITFVKKARVLLPDTACIMLSQVVSKDMVANAYASGVEFYIQKPVNSIEVESVIKRVSQALTARRTLEKVQNIFMEQKPASASLSFASPEPLEKPHIVRLRSILQKLGIIGEKGSKDIITLVDYLIEHGEKMQDATLEELCGRFSDSPKTMEQRIRRTAISGMVNLANLGLEDYSNDIFVTYANSLYNFEQVRREMDYIRGKSDRHGNVKIKNFLNSLMLACIDS